MNRQGFTLIELAVLLVVVGLLTTAGLSLFPRILHEKNRVSTRKYQQESKAALLAYVQKFAALPQYQDTDMEKVLLPTEQLRLPQVDPFGVPLRFVTAPAMQDPAAVCQTLKDYYADATGWNPRLWEIGMPEILDSGMPVAALLISSGGDGVFGEKFVIIEGEPAPVKIADNSQTSTSMTLSFMHSPENDNFDDLVVPITVVELLAALPECQP